MGIEYKAAIIVGLPAKDLVTDEGDFNNNYGESKLKLVPLYFDASIKDSYIGIVVYEIEYGALEISLVEAQMRLYKAMDDFRNETGRSGKTTLCTWGY